MLLELPPKDPSEPRARHWLYPGLHFVSLAQLAFLSLSENTQTILDLGCSILDRDKAINRLEDSGPTLLKCLRNQQPSLPPPQNLHPKLLSSRRWPLIR